MALVDQYGKAIKQGRPILDELGVTAVRNMYSTYPSRGLTPERLAEKRRIRDHFFMTVLQEGLVLASED